MKLYQWKVNQYQRQYELEKKVFDVIEKPKTFSLETGTFLDYLRAVKKRDLDTVVVGSWSRSYTSLDDNHQTAVNKLLNSLITEKRDKIEQLENEIEQLETLRQLEVNE